jgi:hypothetical protein
MDGWMVHDVENVNDHNYVTGSSLENGLFLAINNNINIAKVVKTKKGGTGSGCRMHRRNDNRMQVFGHITGEDAATNIYRRRS